MIKRPIRAARPAERRRGGAESVDEELQQGAATCRHGSRERQRERGGGCRPWRWRFAPPLQPPGRWRPRRRCSSRTGRRFHSGTTARSTAGPTTSPARIRRSSDANPGTREKPLRTIGRAAEILQPGERVVVHEGVYRECVSPRRGGKGPRAMIAYEAADGERVVVTRGRALAAALPAELRLGARPSRPPGWPISRRSSWRATTPSSARNIHEEFVIYRNLDDAAQVPAAAGEGVRRRPAA